MQQQQKNNNNTVTEKSVTLQSLLFAHQSYLILLGKLLVSLKVGLLPLRRFPPN